MDNLKDDTEEEFQHFPPNPIVRVCNLSAYASETQVRTLLEFIGRMQTYVFYPKDKKYSTNTKVAYARFEDPQAHKTAVHLTGTLFLDRPLIVLPMTSSIIPDESTIIHFATQLHAKEDPKLPESGATLPTKSAVKYDFGFPYIPPPIELPDSLSHKELLDTRKTVFVHNIHKDITPEILLTLLSYAGEIRYVRLFDEKHKETKLGYVEFTEQSNVQAALQFHEFPLNSLPIRVTYSKISIDKSSDERRYRSRSKSFERFTRSVVYEPPTPKASSSSSSSSRVKKSVKKSPIRRKNRSSSDTYRKRKSKRRIDDSKEKVRKSKEKKRESTPSSDRDRKRSKKSKKRRRERNKSDS